jgi:hypothetical protein
MGTMPPIGGVEGSKSVLGGQSSSGIPTVHTETHSKDATDKDRIIIKCTIKQGFAG